MSDWFFTRGGSEFRQDVSNIGRHLGTLARILTTITEGLTRESRLRDLAWDLFKKEIDKAEAIASYNGTQHEQIDEGQVRYYRDMSLRVAHIFLEDMPKP